MGKGILVAFASNSGSTAEIARVVAEELGRKGIPVDVRPVDGLSPAEVSAYDALVLGAPMILGWHRHAVRFAKSNRATLARIPYAIFVTAISLTKTDEVPQVGVPVFIDPKLPKPPRRPERLGLKERYATLGNYLKPILKTLPAAAPTSLGFFAGRLDFGRLKFFQMLFIMLILGAQPGDYRNWDAIRDWARELGPKLAKG